MLDRFHLPLHHLQEMVHSRCHRPTSPGLATGIVSFDFLKSNASKRIQRSCDSKRSTQSSMSSTHLVRRSPPGCQATSHHPATVTWSSSSLQTFESDPQRQRKANENAKVLRRLSGYAHSPVPQLSCGKKRLFRWCCHCSGV